MNNIELTNLSKEQLISLQEQIDKKLKEDEINPKMFEKFIWRNWKVLIIKWQLKYLVSHYNWNIDFTGFRFHNNDKLNIQETTLDKLEVNDMFIFKNNIENIGVRHFNVILWIDNYNDFICQYLENNYQIERIDSVIYSPDNTAVIKFLRN